MVGGAVCHELRVVEMTCYARPAAARMIISHDMGILAFMSSIRRWTAALTQARSARECARGGILWGRPVQRPCRCAGCSRVEVLCPLRPGGSAGPAYARLRGGGAVRA